MSCKIEPASLVEFLKASLGKNVIGRAYQAKFIYPRQGIQKIIDYSAKDIRDAIVVNAGVEKIVKDNGTWNIVLNNSRTHKADTIISTLPLVELLKKVSIEGLQQSYEELKWNNTFFVMVGLKKGRNFSLINNCHWAFF